MEKCTLARYFLMIFSHFLYPFIYRMTIVNISNIVSKECVDPYTIDLPYVCVCVSAFGTFFLFSFLVSFSQNAYLPFTNPIFTVQKSNPFLPLNLSQFFFLLQFCYLPHRCLYAKCSRAEFTIPFAICLSGNFIESISFERKSIAKNDFV